MEKRWKAELKPKTQLIIIIIIIIICAYIFSPIEQCVSVVCTLHPSGKDCSQFTIFIKLKGSSGPPPPHTHTHSTRKLHH